MQSELAFLKTAMLSEERLSAKPARRPVQIRGGEVEIAEARDLQRRVNRLRGFRLRGFGRGHSVMCQMGRRGRRGGGWLGRSRRLPLFELSDSLFQGVDSRQKPFDQFPGG